MGPLTSMVDVDEGTRFTRASSAVTIDSDLVAAGRDPNRQRAVLEPGTGLMCHIGGLVVKTVVGGGAESAA